MSNMLLVKPLAPAAIAASTGTGGANLGTVDPKEVWASAAGGTASNFDFDFGAAAPTIDSVFIGFIGGAATAPTFTWTSGAAAYTTTNNLNAQSAFAPTSSAAPPRRHLLRRLAAPLVGNRYHRIAFTPGVAGTTTIGIIVFGLALQTTYNREWGSGRQIIDTGTKERLLGGGFGIGEGARKAGFKWTWGDLTDAEAEAVYDVGLDRGETRPIVVCEDPDLTTGLNERLHYALFDRFEAYSRDNPNLTRWALSVEQWV